MKASTLKKKHLWQVENHSVKVVGICQKLLGCEFLDPKAIEITDVRKEPGIYLWARNETLEPVYIGIGLGKQGLHSRIWCQHLRVSYTKSALRRKIAKELAAGGPVTPELLRQGSLDFLKDNFLVACLPCAKGKFDPATIRSAQSLLISTFKTKYNSEAKWNVSLVRK